MTIQELERETKEEYSLDSIETIEELENIVRSMGIPIVSFYEFDINVAREVVEALGAILKKYPALKKTICAVGSTETICFNQNVLHYNNKKDDKENPSVIWQDYISEDKVTLMQSSCLYNPNYYPKYIGISYGNKDEYSSIKNVLKASAANGYHPPSVDSIKAHIYHEVGHVLDFILFIKMYINDIFKDNPIEVAKKISRYTIKNTDMDIVISESIAEAFAEYTINPETENETIRKIGEVIDRVYKFHENGPLFNINRDYGINMKFPEEEPGKKK